MKASDKIYKIMFNSVHYWNSEWENKISFLNL